MRKSLTRITLRQLQIFNEVCDLRSYSRAAEEMSLTQPAVSLQIRQLEELVGQPLFEYVGKKLYLTDAAEALKREHADDVALFVGGTIPRADWDSLKASGVDCVFDSEMSLAEVVDEVARELDVLPKTAAAAVTRVLDSVAT